MEIFTDSLRLKTVGYEDIHEVARMWAFEKGNISVDQARKAIEGMRENHEKNRAGAIYHLCLAVYEKAGDSIIGWCGLDGKSGDKLHIFYMIDIQYRSRGYATQCAARLLAYAFEEAGVPFVNGGCDKNNIASFTVMSNAGMIQNAFEENGDPLFYLDRTAYFQAKCDRL